MYKIGDWVNINQCYRDLDPDDWNTRNAYYGQVIQVGRVGVYRIHFNTDYKGWVSESEISPMPDRQEAPL